MHARALEHTGFTKCYECHTRELNATEELQFSALACRGPIGSAHEKRIDDSADGANVVVTPPHPQIEYARRCSSASSVHKSTNVLVTPSIEHRPIVNSANYDEMSAHRAIMK
jgi:hypothetical protein